jgi:hypothetical protein
MGRVKRRRKVGKGGRTSRCLRVRLLLGGIEVSFSAFDDLTQLTDSYWRRLPSRYQGLVAYRREGLEEGGGLSYENDLTTTLYNMMIAVARCMYIVDTSSPSLPACTRYPAPQTTPR